MWKRKCKGKKKDALLILHTDNMAGSVVGTESVQRLPMLVFSWQSAVFCVHFHSSLPPAQRICQEALIRSLTLERLFLNFRGQEFKSKENQGERQIPLSVIVSFCMDSKEKCGRRWSTKFYAIFLHNKLKFWNMSKTTLFSLYFSI